MSAVISHLFRGNITATIPLIKKNLTKLKSKLGNAGSKIDDIAKKLGILLDDVVDGKTRRKTADDIIKGLPDTTISKGGTRNFESSGGFEQTLKDFDSLELSNVREIQSNYGAGKIGYLEDGVKVIARPGSKTGGSTLEIVYSKSKIYKIRY